MLTLSETKWIVYSNLLTVFSTSLTVSETKLDSYFPTGQFNLSGLRTPYRKDLSAKSGGLLVYVNSNIPSKVLKIPDCPSNIQVIPVQINLKKEKWLVIAIYTPPSHCKNYFITKLTKILDKCRGSDENTLTLEGTLTLFRMELFWSCSRMGGGGHKGPPPKSLSPISCNDEKWHSYTLTKKDPRNM